MKKKKICLMITKGVWGGAQEYVYTLATHLNPQAYDISVLCGEGHTLQEKLREKNIKTYTLASLRRDISVIDEVYSFIELILFLKKEKPDILHLNSSKIGLLGGLAGRLTSVPRIIFTAHGWASNESRPWIQKKIFLLLHFLTISLSHVTIMVSKKTQKDVEYFPYVKAKSTLIYNGIGPIDFKTKEEARNILAEKVSTERIADTIIGTISELHKTKGLDVLIKASYTLPHNVSVFIIGEGSERENLQNLIETYKVSHKVFLLGRIPEAKTLLKAFNIFTLTSRTEALPYTILEAGLAYLPVVASNIGGIPEIIENNKDGLLIEKEDGKHLQNILHDLIRNEKRRGELGKHLKEKVESKFGITAMVKKTEKLYRF